MSTRNTDPSKVLVSRTGKRKRKAPLPPVQILRSWLSEHRFNACPSAAEKRMLSEQTHWSCLRISKWFINARRRLPPELLPRNGDRPNQTTRHHQKGQVADMPHQGGTEPSTQAKSGPRDPEETQGLPASPPPMARESGGNLLDPELAPVQKFTPKAQPQAEVDISTSRFGLMSSPKPVSTEGCNDFSNFQLLVDVAVQKAAELELQKQQEANP